MFIPIPLGETLRCSATATIPKFVLCENCGIEYVYLSTRSGTGEGTNALWMTGAEADQQARAQAQSSLQEALKNAIDPIPCPKCGSYQSSMVPAARKLHLYKRKVYAPYVVLFSLPIIFFFWSVYKYADLGWIGWCLLAGSILVPIGAVAGFIHGTISSAAFDPNSLPQSVRLEIGKRHAMTKEDFLSLVSEAQSAEYPTKQPQIINCDV